MPYPIETQILGSIGMLALAACLLLVGRLWARESPVLATLAPVRDRLTPVLRLHARRLGAYVLEDKIGEGAMGEVYRARHAALGRATAVKVLRREASQREHERFEQEARLTAQLRHPNSVAVYDYGRAADGTSYYAMELLEGVTLQELVERYGAQPAGRVIGILLQLCAALRETHGAGLVHRDVKPDNVFLCRQGGALDVAKLLDFGLVKQVTQQPEPDEGARMVLGTPLYMSPEAIAAPETVSAQSDLYGLGALAYFLLTGSPVFVGDSVVEVCTHQLHSPPERLSRVATQPIAEDLEDVVLACLAKDPTARPASAAELARRLERCIDADTWADADADAWWADPQSASLRRHTDTIACGVRTMHRALCERRACA